MINTATRSEKKTFEYGLYVLFIISALAFLCYKIYYLHIGYFWDESWVYGPAVSEMASRFPSLLPGSIDIDLSRGHPMLFHFLGGLWGNIFGHSVTSLHAFALTTSLSLLTSLFYVACRLLDKTWAILATILLMVQGMFLAQSAMVLPEVMLALWGLLALYFTSNEKYFLSCIFIAFATLTKESGAMLAPIIGISYLIHELLNKSFSWKKSFLLLGFMILAILPYLSFLMIQKARFGWYFYPNHIDLQIKHIHVFQAQLQSAVRYLIFAQGRILLTTSALLLACYHYRKKRLLWVWLAFVLFHLIAIFLMPWGRWSSLAIYSALFLASLILMLSTLTKNYKPHHYFYLLVGISFMIFFSFTAYNFFSSRYLLLLLPPYLLLIIKIYSVSLKPLLGTILLTAIMIILAVISLKRHPVSDVSQAFIDVGQAQKELFLHLEENDMYEEVFLAPFLLHEALKKQNAGYRSTSQNFSNVPYFPAPNAAFYNIVSSFEGELINNSHKENREKQEIKKFTAGDVFFILEKYSPASEELRD